AFFALVILWSSTVSSISSQTQPQNVQVASRTIFISVISDLPAKSLAVVPGSAVRRGSLAWSACDWGTYPHGRFRIQLCRSRRHPVCGTGPSAGHRRNLLLED